MKLRSAILCTCLFVYCMGIGYTTASLSKSTESQALSSYGKLPLFFVENKGQADTSLQFYSYGGQMYFSPEGIYTHFIQRDSTAHDRFRDRYHERDFISQDTTPIHEKHLVLKKRFLNANTHCEIMGEEELPGKINYFIGNDSTKWHTNLRTFKQIRYKNLYPGIDLVYHGNQGPTEYDLVINPEAHNSVSSPLTQIQFTIEGADKLELSPEGDLLVHTPMGILKEKSPVSYQMKNGIKQTLSSHFTLTSDNTFAFNVPQYDKTQSLVIDPLIYSTFLGGSGNDEINDIAINKSGNAYVAGYTTSIDFPITPGSYDSTFISSNINAFVTKLNSSGSALIYSTYLGGGVIDSLILDEFENVFITGHTSSSTFPTTVGAYDQSLNGNEDVFITKLNTSGSALFYSTILGGSEDDYVKGIAVDERGNAYVSGYTSSSTNFPTTSGAYDCTYNGGAYDVFITKLNPSGSNLIYSSYLGGNYKDYSAGIEVDGAGNAYIAGYTSSSTDFPTTSGAYNQTSKGGFDCFITKINSTGTDLVFSTYLGGEHADGCYYDFIWGYDRPALNFCIDNDDNVYIMGFTCSTSFPTTGGAYKETPYSLYDMYSGHIAYDYFVSKLNSSGSNLIYSTFLQGPTVLPSIDFVGITVDKSGNVYLTGYTGTSTFPTTDGAIDRTFNGGGFHHYDAFVTQLNIGGSALVYSTYLGGSNDEDFAYDIAVDIMGNAYVTGQTFSNDYPTTSGAFDQTFDASEAFITKLTPTPGPASCNFTCSPSSGNSPLTVSFYDQSNVNASSWYWEFGDGGTSTEQNPVHIYTSSVQAQYNVRLTIKGSFGTKVKELNPCVSIGYSWTLKSYFDYDASKACAGVVSDGAAECWLVFKNPAGKDGDLVEFFVNSKFGSFPDNPGPMSLKNGEARIRYRAPKEYPGGPAWIWVNYNGVCLGKRNLEIKPCPVLLVHGLWSSNDTWQDEFKDIFLSGNTFPFTKAINYGGKQNDYASLYFAAYYPKIPEGIGNLLLEVRKAGYTAKKVDVVGHSMGGLLTRGYIENLCGVNYRGDIRRLVTIGTPHSGSQLANVFGINCLLPTGYVLIPAMNAIHYPPLNGAVSDLCVDSYAIDDRLNNSARIDDAYGKVKVYAIHGDGNPDDLAKGLNWKINKILKFMYPSHSIDDIEAEIFGDNSESDYVVSGISQKGGLDNNYETISVGSHLSETNNSNIAFKVKNLLLGSESAFADGFNPDDIHYFSNINKSVGVIRSYSTGTVMIETPADGAAVSDGQPVYCRVTTTGDVSRVVFVTYFGSTTITAAPFEWTFTVPADAVDSFTLFAGGIDTAGQLFTCDTVTLYPLISAELNSIDITEDEVTVMEGKTHSLTVMGNYADGTTRNISCIAGIEYLSWDTVCSTVDSYGIVSGIQAGTSCISVTFGAFTDSVLIHVADGKPDAGFYSFDTQGTAPLSARFYDGSSNNPISWSWSFGDGGTENSKNPIHIFTSPGKYSVQLIVSNAYGSDTMARTGYITVLSKDSSKPVSGSLPAVKLFTNETVDNGLFRLEDYNQGGISTTYSLLTNFLGLSTLSGDTLFQYAYSQPTAGSNIFRLANLYGASTTIGKVKYSSYKLRKLPFISLRPGESEIVDLSKYCHAISGLAVPASFGNNSALVISDTTQLTAQWFDTTRLQITAIGELSTPVSIDVITSPETSDFGIDMDKERLYVYPNLLNIGKFTTFNDIWNYGIEKTTDKVSYPAISFLTTANDGTGTSQSNVMCFDFTSTTQGIKMTPQFSNMIGYEANSWYVARMKVCSPTNNNDLQSQLYHYSGIIPDNAHIDISANIYFGTPTTWSWIETPLYATTTGTGYPQLMLKAGSKTGKLYLAEVQVIKAVPTLYNSTRSKHTLGYAYSNFSSLSYLAMGWSTTECFDNGTSKPALSVVNPGVLTVNFSNAPADGKSLKFTAWNENTQKIYTPSSTPGSEVGMKADINIASGSFDSYNAMVFLGCYGVATNGSYEFYNIGGQLAAMAEFGQITHGTHYLAAPGRNGYHQMQFVLKNSENGILNIQNVDFLRDTDDPYYGDMSLFP